MEEKKRIKTATIVFDEETSRADYSGSLLPEQVISILFEMAKQGLFTIKKEEKKE